MKLTTSLNANENYIACIVDIKEFKKHDNADKLQIANVLHNQVITTIDDKPGLYVYFPVECQIDSQILSKLNMFQSKELNENKTKSGYIDNSGRVKCLSLRGVISEGLILPIENLLLFADCNLNNIKLKHGTLFDTIDNKKVCWKFIPKKEIKNQSNSNTFENLILDHQFRFHIDTKQLKYFIDDINPSDLIQASIKQHGTSAIYSNLLLNKKLSKKEKLFKFFGVNIVEKEYVKFCSSRNKIKDPEPLQLEYYNYNIWNLTLEIIKPYLHNGLTIYAEIVGYLPSGAMIQKNYDYGCKFDLLLDYSKMSAQQMYEEGLFNIIIYRITHTNEKGHVLEYTTQQIIDFCDINNLNHVVELYYGFAKDILTVEEQVNFKDNLINKLSELYLENDSTICNNKVPEEGIVIRKENYRIKSYKLKSKRFLLKETEQLDTGEIDMETEN